MRLWPAGLVAAALLVPAGAQGAGNGMITSPYAGSVTSGSTVNVTCEPGEQGPLGSASITVAVGSGSNDIGNGDSVRVSWAGQTHLFEATGSTTLSSSTVDCPPTNLASTTGSVTFTPWRTQNNGAAEGGAETQTITLTYNRVGSSS